MAAGKLPIGSQVAGYRLISLLGEGATGAVYLAEAEATGERVALKVLDPELARDERFRRRLLTESRIAASLDHPNVVPILDFGETDAALYLAMRYVEGSDLRALLAAEGPLDAERALRLLDQVASALDEAHEHGLVHRDVKPANILVDHEGHAYLGDFGLAKHATSASSLTRDQAFVGTIAYVSPEQIRGDELDGRADVYSLGCVLYECLAGAPRSTATASWPWSTPTSTSARRAPPTYARTSPRASTTSSARPWRRSRATASGAARNSWPRRAGRWPASESGGGGWVPRWHWPASWRAAPWPPSRCWRAAADRAPSRRARGWRRAARASRSWIRSGLAWPASSRCPSAPPT